MRPVCTGKLASVLFFFTQDRSIDSGGVAGRAPFRAGRRRIGELVGFLGTHTLICGILQLLLRTLARIFTGRDEAAKTDREYLLNFGTERKCRRCLESMCRLLNVAYGAKADRLQIVVETRITIEASIAHLSDLKAGSPKSQAVRVRGPKGDEFKKN